MKVDCSNWGKAVLATAWEGNGCRRPQEAINFMRRRAAGVEVSRPELTFFPVAYRSVHDFDPRLNDIFPQSWLPYVLSDNGLMYGDADAIWEKHRDLVHGKGDKEKSELYKEGARKAARLRSHHAHSSGSGTRQPERKVETRPNGHR